MTMATEVETNPVPVKVTVVSGLPVGIVFGETEVNVGTGLLIVKVRGLEVPPPGAGLDTVIEAVPAVAMSAAVIEA